MKKAIVIGAGVAGITASHLLSKDKWQVTLIEKENYLGGGFKTFYYGGHPFTLGPRPLVSRREQETHVFEFVNKLVPLRRLEHNMYSYVERDGNFYSYPVHEDDIPKMPDKDKIFRELISCAQSKKKPKNFEEFWQGLVGNTLYDKFINAYSKKMWQLKSNTQLKEFKWSPKGKALKTGARYLECVVGYPYAMDGFESYFKNCTKDVSVLLGAAPRKIDPKKRIVEVRGKKLSADIIVNTISLDDFFGHRYGTLPYLGRDFIKLVLPAEHIFPENVQYVYYPNDEEFLRVVEYKKLTYYRAPTSLLVMEVPSHNNGKLYPLPLPKSLALAKKYLNALPENCFAIGRLGTYTYSIDLEGIVLQAFELMKKLK